MVKKVFLVLAIILSVYQLDAQLPTIAWERCYGGSLSDNCFAIWFLFYLEKS